jgi:hypothetical protein
VFSGHVIWRWDVGPGKELAQSIDRMASSEAREDGCEVGLRIDGVELAGLD